MLVKLWKLIAVAVAGAIAFIRKKLMGKKKNESSEIAEVKEEEKK